MRILVTGHAGMLGRSVMRVLADREPVGVDRAECDITQPEQVDRCIGELAPDCVIHCAAMTAVDDCETRQDEAWAVNALGAGLVAAACTRAKARLIALSTDYVFSGRLGRPAHEWDAPAPCNTYGLTKLAGERMIRDLCPNHLIVRTAWLYGPGGPSFVHAMLRLGLQDAEPLRVVDDQRGNPTSTRALVEALARLVDTTLCGTVHLTCEGETTWFGLARAIFQRLGLSRPIAPCRSEEFPRPALRPPDSRLENRVLRLAGLDSMPDWQDALDRFLHEYPHG